MNKLKLQRVLGFIQTVVASFTLFLILLSFVINSKPYFDGAFRIGYSALLLIVSLATIGITVAKSKVEQSIIDSLNKSLYTEAKEIRDSLSGKK